MQAIMAYPLKVFRKYMLQEPPDEFHRRQGHLFQLAIILIVVIFKRHLAIRHVHDPMVADRYPEDISA
jgi:hypothetical protein